MCQRLCVNWDISNGCEYRLYFKFPVIYQRLIDTVCVCVKPKIGWQGFAIKVKTAEAETTCKSAVETAVLEDISTEDR